MSGGRNCYPKSDVLINKYNIRDKELLEKFEIQKVFAKLLGLDVKPARVAYTYEVEHIVNIHKYSVMAVKIQVKQMRIRVQEAEIQLPEMMPMPKLQEHQKMSRRTRKTADL